MMYKIVYLGIQGDIINIRVCCTPATPDKVLIEKAKRIVNAGNYYTVN